jgi:hypothetical protein
MDGIWQLPPVMKEPIFERAGFLPSIFVTVIFAFSAVSAKAAILWEQNFSGSTDLASYVGTGANQADGISTSGAGLVWSIADDSLRALRTGNAGAITINGDDWNAAVLQVEIRMQIADITSTYGSGLMFAAGSGFTTGNSHPGNALTHSDFGINFADGAIDTYQFRDHNTGTNLGSALQTGQWMDVWWGINNSGSDLTYMKPDGTIGTLTDGHWDLWVKAEDVWSQLGNNPANLVNTGTVLDDFKITYQNASGDILFDSIRLSDTIIAVVPEPSTGLAIWLFAMGVGGRRFRSERV